jgi:UDP-3-O-[3-hydroxymyristoyl] glucosamine N-acyltransferase
MIHPGVVIYDGTTIGNNVNIQANSVIGGDAFYFNKRKDEEVMYLKLESCGTTIIEDDVEIGACCTIDRGVSGITIIGRGTKFDNYIHIGHGTIVGKNCLFAAQVGVAGKVIIGDNVLIYPNVTVLDESTIGNQTTIWSGTVIRERCHIGSHCIVHPNATIGADGFGFRPDPERGLVKIPQIGNVIIGNGVEIGANSCVDRGKFSSTIVGDGCKIDNLVQIGHGSQLGTGCAIAGQSGMAGGVKVGNRVILAGQTGIANQVKIGDGAIASAQSGIHSDVAPGDIVSGSPAIPYKLYLKVAAIYSRLPEMYKSLKELQRQIGQK